MHQSINVYLKLLLSVDSSICECNTKYWRVSECFIVALCHCPIAIRVMPQQQGFHSGFTFSVVSLMLLCIVILFEGCWLLWNRLQCRFLTSYSMSDSSWQMRPIWSSVSTFCKTNLKSFSVFGEKLEVRCDWPTANLVIWPKQTSLRKACIRWGKKSLMQLNSAWK
jgi:hypothetical protein